MSCPIHIWAPLAAAAVPMVHVLRERMSSITQSRRKPAPAREVKRWAPVADSAVRSRTTER